MPIMPKCFIYLGNSVYDFRKKTDALDPAGRWLLTDWEGVVFHGAVCTCITKVSELRFLMG